MILLALAATVPAKLEAGARLYDADCCQFIVPARANYISAMVEDVKGSRKGKVVTVIRSDNWQREVFENGASISTTIVDLRSGYSVSFDRDDHGKYKSLSTEAGAAKRSVIAEKTTQIDHALGEDCEVWRFNGDLISSEACITADHVMLWQRSLGDHNMILGSWHAAWIKRAKVIENQASPPPEIFDLELWGSWAVNQPRYGGDEVTLKADDAPPSFTGPSLNIRRLGSYWSEVSVHADATYKTYRTPALLLSVKYGEGGIFENLYLRTGRRILRFGEPDEASLPDLPRKTKVILGRKCSYFSPVIKASEGSSSSCLTDTGILLEKSTWGWGSGQHLTAVSATTGQTSIADVTPPKDILKAR